MKVIDEMIQELAAISTEWGNSEISTEMFMAS